VPVKVLAVFFRAIRSFRKNRPYAPEVIHRILRQAAGGTSEQEHTLPDVLWNHESHMRFPTDMKLLWESIEWLYSLLQEKKEESFKDKSDYTLSSSYAMYFVGTFTEYP